jgi:hypothetical protein
MAGRAGVIRARLTYAVRRGGPATFNAASAPACSCHRCDGTHALPMAVVMATLPLAGLACPLVLARPSVARTVPLDAKEVVERLG